MSTTESSFPKVNMSRRRRDLAIEGVASELTDHVWELVDGHSLSSQELSVVLAIMSTNVARAVLKDARDQEIPQA